MTNVETSNQQQHLPTYHGAGEVAALSPWAEHRIWEDRCQKRCKFLLGFLEPEMSLLFVLCEKTIWDRQLDRDYHPLNTMEVPFQPSNEILRSLLKTDVEQCHFQDP